MAKVTPFELLMHAFTVNGPARKLSLKQKGEAIELASRFYANEDYENCALSLLRTSDNPLTASVDILTQIYCNVFSYTADSPHDKQLMVTRIARGVSIIAPEELSYNEKLEKLLIKTIESCNEEKFAAFLNEEKSSNALAQLEEVMPDVFARMLSMFNHGNEEVSPLGQDGKEDESDAE